MKRMLPLMWRYLLAVAVSCSLAFLISQTDAEARTPAGPQEAKDYAARGPHAVAVTEAAWRDGARDRSVPVRLYFPKDGGGAGDAKRPVILFSHGLGGNVAAGKRWAEHWAQHGFIVVAMQHPGSDESLWKGRLPADIKKSMQAGMTVNNLGLRVGDVRFVIDELGRRAKAREEPFANADLAAIGMSGHSFGAHTTMAVAGQASGAAGGQSGLDTRVTAAIAFSPNARNKRNLDRQFGDIRIPFFSITGSADGSVLDDATRPEHRVLPYEHMPAGGKYLAVFEAGDHGIFGGQEFGRRAETARDREIVADVKALTLAFWLATLKGDAAARAWLGKDAAAILDAKDRYAQK